MAQRFVYVCVFVCERQRGAVGHEVPMKNYIKFGYLSGSMPVALILKVSHVRFILPLSHKVKVILQTALECAIRKSNMLIRENVAHFKVSHSSGFALFHLTMEE